MAAPRQAAAVMLGAVLRGTRPGPGWAAALGGGLPGSPLVQAARAYARPVRRSRGFFTSFLNCGVQNWMQDSSCGLTTAKYKGRMTSQDLLEKHVWMVDDVVKKILSLEMAGQREKVKIKMEQLAEKVRRAPNDNGSSEVQVAYLTAKIRSYQEHLQKHPKDARNRRMMLMAIDQRKKILKYLRRTRYDVFENTCKQLDIEYTFPPPYCRKVTKLWLVKKAFCLQALGKHCIRYNTHVTAVTEHARSHASNVACDHK
uniref:Small ribosomal subunit protein uS15m n=1 Tax=Crocodylus porosus TaxID=8502 RepID=A0A7M4E306_CROPO